MSVWMGVCLYREYGRKDAGEGGSRERGGTGRRVKQEEGGGYRGGGGRAAPNFPWVMSLHPGKLPLGAGRERGEGKTTREKEWTKKKK